MSSPAQQEDSSEKIEESSGDRDSESSDTIENSGTVTDNSTSCLTVEDIPPIDGSGDNSPPHSPPKTTPNLSTPNENDQPCVSSKVPVKTTTDTSLFGNKDVSDSRGQNASLIEDMATKIDSIFKETKPKQVLDAIASAEASGTSTPGEPDDDEMVLKWEDDDDEVDDLIEKDLSNITKPQVCGDDSAKVEENKESDYHSTVIHQSLEVEMTTETQTMENVDVVIDSENEGKSLEKSVDEGSTSKQLSSSAESIEHSEDYHILKSNDSETDKPNNTIPLDVQKTESSELDEEISNLKDSIENSNETIEHPQINIVGTVSKDINIESKLSANNPTKISNEQASQYGKKSTEVEVADIIENIDQMDDQPNTSHVKQTDDTFSTDIRNIDSVCESNNANDSEMEVDSSNANLNPGNDSEMEIDTSVEKPVDQQSNVPAESSVINLDEPTKNFQDIDLSQISQDQNKNPDVSAMDISIEALDHGLVKPDMMIEIPTQELIDCTDTEKTDSDLTNSKDDADKDSSTDTNITALVDKIDKIIHESEEQPKTTSQKVHDGDMETGNIDTPEKEVTPVTDIVQLEIVTKNFESPEVSSNIEAVPINLPDITDNVTANIEAGSLIKGIDDIKEIAEEDKSPRNSKCETEQTELQRDSENNEASSTISVTENFSELNIPIKDNNIESITPTVTPEIANPENDSAKIDVSQKNTEDIAENIVTKVEANVEASPIERTSIAETSDAEKTSTATVETALESQSKSPEIPPKELDDLKPSSMEVQESEKVSKEAETPSSYMAPDTSDEVPEMTDSLGLLAESSRVMEDDEEQESERDDGDDDDDFDPDDESSNQMTGDQSEDSNAQQSESDVPKGAQVDGSGDKDGEKNEFSFAISNVVSGDVEKDMDVDEACDEDESAVDVADEDSTLMEEAQASPADAPMEESLDIEDNMPEVADKLSSELEADLNEEPSDKDSAIQDDEKKKDTILKDLLAKTSAVPSITPPPASNQTMSPPKVKKLEISKPKHVMNFVDLEESSSEDDVQEISKKEEPAATPDDVTTVNLPADIEIMSSGENTSEITTKETEITIRGVPKPPPLKPARLNTDEVTIKTATNTESTLVFPEDKIDQSQGEKTKPKFSLEVFSLDSDDEESVSAPEPAHSSLPPSPQVEPEKSQRCVNLTCKSDHTVSYSVADSSTLAFYDAKKKRAMVCERCAEVVVQRAYMLVEGMKSLTPLLELEIRDSCQDLVEISDSDSEDELDPHHESSEKIGPGGVAFLEKHLASVLNDTWAKYKMEERLQEAEIELSADLDRLQHESDEINEMLKECQKATDKLRDELYATFDPERQELPAIAIMDTPSHTYTCTEVAQSVHEVRQQKRRLSMATETPNKKFAIPLAYTPLDSNKAQKEVPKPVVPAVDTSKVDDDKDVSVVTLSAEAAPADLPPPGELTRPLLRIGAQVFAMRNAFSSWVKAKVIDLLSKGPLTTSQFSMYRVKFETKTAKSPYKILPGRCLAYNEPTNVRMTIGTRLIALFKDERQAGREPFYSGVVAEVPNPVNNYRYLVFFDDGYAQYVSHADTRLVSECSQVVWDEVHPFSREFVRQYLLAYPERPMVRLHTGQRLKIELNGKWWVCRVIQVDASLVQVNFEEDKRTEWIYRGSTRLAPLYLELQAAERTRARPLPRNRAQKQSNMPYVEYTRSDEQEASKAAARAQANVEELRRQRAVAKKSTSSQPPAAPAQASDAVSSRVVYYTPKNAVKPHKMVAHSCGPQCRRTDVLALSELRTYNPLAKPLLSGWERQIVRYKGSREVMYRAPCGRRVRSLQELHRYLRVTACDMPVDLFDFAPHTHCLAEFVLNKCIVAKKDLSHGKENVPVPCVNYYDESLPEFCSYNTERTPTAGVPLNLDPEFLCGCDCTDDCEDKTKCACWKMTLEGARTIGIRGSNVGYVYKRLPEPLPSGIYECNSRCKCKHTCLNRVAQHPLQLKLQVFKTLNRGWGIRALNDVPKGAFLCVYAGNLLTDATANLDGLNEGDEYLAELDYIEVVEQMKEGYEEDIPKDSVLGKDGVKKEESDTEEESSTSEEEETPSKNEREDGDFEPGYIPIARTQFSKRLRRRDKVKKEKEENANGEKKETEDDCITISDDEEIREPSRFTAQAGMGANQFVSKYRSVRSHFGKDEACYIMDAKVQGNIGRYLNHSCSPNVFVQNVFVDTHDPRFPWVAFFALSHIRAGTELTWNYNYDVGSVPGKALYCYCGAQNCRGRLL